jgi:predicted nucleotidyltransferase
MGLGINELLKDKREKILDIAAQYGVQNVRVFGSVARSEARSDSDIDFLIDWQAQHSLLDRIALKQDLEDLLARQVDIVTEKTLRDSIRERILQEAIPL